MGTSRSKSTASVKIVFLYHPISSLMKGHQILSLERTSKSTLSKPTLPWDHSEPLQMGMYPTSDSPQQNQHLQPSRPDHHHTITVSEAGASCVLLSPSSFSVLPQSRCQDNDSAGDGGLALPLETNKVFALWVDSTHIRESNF